MSYRVVEVVLDGGPTDLRETLVLLSIAESANDRGYAYPGVAMIARRSRISERHALRLIKRLAMDEWLTVLPNAEGPSKKQTAYELNLTKLQSRSACNSVGAQHPLQALVSRRPFQEKYPSDQMRSSDDILASRQVTSGGPSGDIPTDSILRNQRTIEPSKDSVFLRSSVLLNAAEPIPVASLSTRSIVQEAFDTFCSAVGKDPKLYTLTTQRRSVALDRAKERLRIHDGCLPTVRREFLQAISNLAASEFHSHNGCQDWTNQIFGSTDEFQRRLSWRPRGFVTSDGLGKSTNVLAYLRARRAASLEEVARGA